MADLKYRVIVGLEIHVQLRTATKIFCGCELAYGQQANSRVCPGCLGLPGSLPVMNKKAFEYAVLGGLALHCEIAKFTKWDRKGYFYPDLPKNYQVSQLDLPVSEHGYIEIPVEGGLTKKIRITRAHLEEDAGKNTHSSGNYSQVDLNRGGAPLLEIVTEPDMSSASEVRALAVELQRIVRYLGISEADMQKGRMRFEPNINLAITKDGKEYKTPIAEIKNLNSFRALERSVNYEVVRQLDEFERTGRVMAESSKTTRGWDDAGQQTVLQREKEDAADYRYFPDPDLLPVVMTDEWLEVLAGQLCELPLKKQMRYVADYNLSEYDAGVLTGDRADAEFFERIVEAGGEPKRVCNLLTQVGLKIANEKGCGLAELGLKEEDVAKLAKMIDDGDISSSAGDRVLKEMTAGEKSPEEIASELNLIQKSDAGELVTFVEAVLAENEKAVEDVRLGGKKSKAAMGFLLGQVMQKTKGRANPKVVSEILNKKLS